MQPSRDSTTSPRWSITAGSRAPRRALGIPKSRLSRHVVALEGKLNVRLVNRSTRRFVVTDVGHEVYRMRPRC